MLIPESLHADFGDTAMLLLSLLLILLLILVWKAAAWKTTVDIRLNAFERALERQAQSDERLKTYTEKVKEDVAEIEVKVAVLSAKLENMGGQHD